MGTYSTVACAEVPGTAHEEYTRDGPTARVILDCAWNQRHLLLDDLLLNQRAWPHAAYTQVPTVARVGIEGEGINSVVNQCFVYSRARVAVEYDTISTSLVSEELIPTVTYQTEDYRQFLWGASDAAGVPLLENQAPGRPLYGMKLRRTLFNLPSIPAQVLTLVGKSNNADYVSSFLGLTFAEETLAFVPPSIRRTLSTGGGTGWNLVLNFMYKEDGWNRWWRGANQGYERIYRRGVLDPYESLPKADFSAVLF